MAQVEAPPFFLLFEPKGVLDDATVGATADTSNPSEVKFRFEQEGGTLVLHTSRLEVADPWAVRPIQFFPELVCVHHPLVLIQIRSTNSLRYPTLFYVYSFSSHTVVRLPKVAPEIWASQSFGLVYNSNRSDFGTYVIANLQREYNQDTKQMEVFLHRWWWSGSSWQSKLNEKVTLPSGVNINMGKWQCDQVITFMDNLLWLDHSQGVILRCNNPSQKCEASFDPILLPRVKRVPRPQTFMSVGCCSGELKHVMVDDTDANIVSVTIRSFNEQSYKSCSQKSKVRKYWDNVNSRSLKCSDLLAAMKNMPALKLSSSLEPSEYHMPCFPVLSRYKDNILQFIMARKDNTGALLLQVNMQSWLLVCAATYPRFSNQQKPLYPSSFSICFSG